MRSLISIYLLSKAFIFLFCAFLFMPLAMIDRFWYANGIESFVFKMIDEFRKFDLISEDQAEEAKRDFK
tara:strand:- start:342 stop:548 length:207 start_codon:yes stop_codon:yes gene_type:complete